MRKGRRQEKRSTADRHAVGQTFDTVSCFIDEASLLPSLALSQRLSVYRASKVPVISLLPSDPWL